MRRSLAGMACLICCCSIGAAPAEAQIASAANASPNAFKLSDVTFFVGEKAWIASWDMRLIDTAVVLPSSAGPPVIQTSSSSRVEDHVLPITSLGARYGDFSLATTISPTTRFNNDQAYGGSIKRSEFDVAAGYAINDNITASLVYKGGKLSQATTVNTAQILGLTGDIRLRGVLAGLYATAPVMNNVRLYGTAAFGPGHAETRLPSGNSRARFNYSIGEVGLNYVIPSASFGAIVLSAGYRIQVISLKDLEFLTLSTSGVQLSSRREDVQSTTHGVVAAITFNFF